MSAVIKTVAKLVNFLSNTKDYSLSKVKVVGHSLGAQIMGEAVSSAKSKVRNFIGKKTI